MRFLELFHRSHGVRKETSPPPAESDLKAIWDRAARDNAQDWIFTGATPAVFEKSGQDDAERLRPYLTAQAHVLNIGCGIGRVEKYLAPLAAHLTGVDISGEMIRLARKRLAGLPNVSLHELGHREFLSSFSAETFDLVFSFLVLQHMEREDAFGYLQDAHRVLKQGGTIYLQFPNFLSPEYTAGFLEGARQHPRSPGRVRPYTQPEADHLLQLAGFTVTGSFLQAGQRGDAEIYVIGKKLDAPNP